MSGKQEAWEKAATHIIINQWKWMKEDRILNLQLAIREACLEHAKKAPVPELEGAFPVVLYFPTDAEREEFVGLVKAAQPNLVARNL